MDTTNKTVCEKVQLTKLYFKKYKNHEEVTDGNSMEYMTYNE